MALVVEGVSVQFQELLVLQNVTFQVQDKEFLCIIGPSGGGKTTLLRVIAGLLLATEGQVLLNGRPPSLTSGQIGFVFQEDALFPWLSVSRNIAFGLHHRFPKPIVLERTSFYLDLVGLTSFGNYYPSQLSGGMRQRAGLARALAYEPELLLLDEPFSSLDVQTRNELQQELLKIWGKEGKTLILVTHSVDEAAFLADRIMILSRRPGQVRSIVKVALPRPRRRTDIEFSSLCEELVEMIER